MHGADHRRQQSCSPRRLARVDDALQAGRGRCDTLQVRRATVERRPGKDWLSAAFTSLAAELSPAWGYAAHLAEYWAKVRCDPPRIEAVGRDFGRSLPGLFWRNHFGRRLTELVGLERLASLPAGQSTPAGDGVLVSLGTDPLAWDTPEHAILEQRVRDHLGPDLFYTKAEPTRPTIIPDFATMARIVTTGPGLWLFSPKASASRRPPTRSYSAAFQLGKRLRRGGYRAEVCASARVPGAHRRRHDGERKEPLSHHPASGANSSDHHG